MHKGRYYTYYRAPMGGEIVTRYEQKLTALGFSGLPAIISAAGERASFRFVEFFTANIRNWNARVSYGRAVREFRERCENRGLQARRAESGDRGWLHRTPRPARR